MLNGAVTNRYTQGLFLVADQHGVTEKVDASLKLVAEALKTYPELKSLIEHPLLGSDHKVQVVQKVFGAEVDPLVMRFLNILVTRGRSAYVEAIYERFHALAEEAKGRVTVQVESAMALTDAQVKSLEEKLSGFMGKQVNAQVSVNPELIAGYRATMKNRVLDATVKGAIEQFSQQLLATGANMGSRA